MLKFFLTALSLCLITDIANGQTTVESCNRQVTFDAPPSAAISNDVNLTEMMLALGLGEHMIGITGVPDWNMLDKNLTSHTSPKPTLSRSYPTLEVLIGAEADFYFAGWNYGLTVGGSLTPEVLESFGILTYELSESCIHVHKKNQASLDDLYNDLLNLGRIFHVEDRARRLVNGYKHELEKFVSGRVVRTEPLRVFVYDSGEDAPFTAGGFAMPTALIEAAGGRNIMEDFPKSWAPVTWESVLEHDPEIVILINYGKITARQKRKFLISSPALSEMSAVKQNRFITLEYVEATPGPRNIQTIKKLAAGFRQLMM